MRLKAHAWAVVVLAALAALVAVPAATTAPTTFPLAESQGFRKAVTVAGIREHQAALQGIATANDGTRSSGTDGYGDSIDYVVGRLEAAGYSPVVQPFEFAFFQELAPAVLEQTSPTPTTYATGTFTYSGSGDVTAAVTPVDVQIPPGAAPNSSTSGCEAADFAGFTPGNVALIQRGTCTFGTKAANAQAAGASAVVIFNEGQPGRTDLIVGTLGAPFTIPVVGLSFADGAAIRNQTLDGPVTLHVKTSTESEIRETFNVVAETPEGDPNRVVVVGAHLDSVLAGPGINDNGSGSGMILEIAEVFAAQDREARNKLRFMWYGAEEFNLLGSAFYVNGLSQAERDKIELMLNFDMVGSPNFVRFVYDGNGSHTPVAGPPGSAAIEQVFLDYFSGVGLLNAPTAFDGRSDYGPFIAVGIPAGGLFTGAEGIKTAQQATDYGGQAGTQYDPCYHQACDTFAGTGGGTSPGLGLTALDQMSDAAAHAVLLWSKRNFDKEPLVTP
ncbi:MAG TPA: M28 family peptidase [Gaiellaceae bacterium]|nr:M28 family peptidase [Gaiellaceae bacterium]